MLLKKTRKNTHVNANKIELGDEEDDGFRLVGDYYLDIPFFELSSTLVPRDIYLASFFDSSFADYGFVISDGTDVHFFNLEYSEKIKNILACPEDSVDIPFPDLITYIEL